VKQIKQLAVSTGSHLLKSVRKPALKRKTKPSKQPSMKLTSQGKSLTQVLQSDTDKKLRYTMTGDKKTRITQPRKWWERLIEILTGSYDG
jgi:hypothetical protein